MSDNELNNNGPANFHPNILTRLIIAAKKRIHQINPRLRSDDFSRNVRNVAYSSADYLLLPILWLISTPLFVSHLGADRFGIWMLVNSIMGVSGIMDFGLTDATIKYVSKYRAQKDETGVIRVIRTTLALYCLSGFAATLILFFVAPILVNHVFKVETGNIALGTIAIQIGGFGIMLRFFDSVFTSTIYGYERYDLAAKIAMLVNSATIILNVALILCGYGLVHILLATNVILLLGASAKAFIVKYWLVPNLRLYPTIDRNTFREIFNFGVFSWLQAILGILNANFDRLLIGTLLGTSAVTYYTIAHRLAQQSHGLLAKGSSFLFPFSGKLFEQREYGRLRSVYNKSTMLIVVLSCGFILPIYLMGASILQVWMGSDFAHQATIILQILCIRYALLPIGIVNYYYLLGTGLVRVQALIALLSAIATICGMWILIPHYGAVGAALGQLFSLPLMIFTRFYVERKIFNRVDPIGTLSYFLPVIVTFGAATIFELWKPILLSTIPMLLLGLVAIAIIGWIISFSVAKICQKSGLMPI